MLLYNLPDCGAAFFMKQIIAVIVYINVVL
jgi:hypothetical protein